MKEGLFSLFSRGSWAYLGMLAPQTCSIFYNDAPYRMVGSSYPYAFLLAEGLCALLCALWLFGLRKPRRHPRPGASEALCLVSLPLLMAALAATAPVLAVAAALIAGAGVTLGYIQWLEQLAPLGPRRAIGYVLIVFVLTGIIKLIALGLPYPIYGGLVVGTLVFSLICQRALRRIQGSEEPLNPSSTVPLATYSPIAVEFVVLSLTLGCLNGLAQMEATALVHILLRLLGALVLFAALFINRRSIDLVPLVQICLLVAIAGPLASALFPVQEKALLAAGWCLMQILVFVIAIVVQERTGCNPAGIFGLGWGIFCIGIAAGYFLTLALPGAVSTQRMVLVVVSVLAVITVYLLMRYQKAIAPLSITPTAGTTPASSSDHSRTAILESLANRYRLTSREIEVAALLGRGLSKRRIAEELVVSENTVRMHVKNIYAKLGIHNKQELLAIIDGQHEPPLPPTLLDR